MAVDPVCGMSVEENESAIKIKHKGETVYFCSKHCMDKYVKQQGIKPDVKLCDSCVGVPWYKQKITLASAFTVLVLILSFYTPQLNPLYYKIIEYFEIIWWAVLLGLLIGGLIDYFVPRQYISHMLSKKEKKTVFNAIFLGFLMSACSHGILAISIQLYRKGASIPAVIAFLMASPWANMTYTILLFSLFGIKAFILILSAVFIALTTGIAYQILDERKLIEDNLNTLELDPSFSVRADVKKRIRKYEFKPQDMGGAVSGVLSGAWSLATMVVWWILLGILAASAVGAFLPQHFFMQYLGPTALGLILTLIAATIIEVCSEGSSPIAFEIFRQTGAFGNSFVFLMAGVATDYTEIGLIWSNIGRKTALWLPVIAGPQIILLGYLFNLFL